MARFCNFHFPSYLLQVLGKNLSKPQKTFICTSHLSEPIIYRIFAPKKSPSRGNLEKKNNNHCFGDLYTNLQKYLSPHSTSMTRQDVFAKGHD